MKRRENTTDKKIFNRIFRDRKKYFLKVFFLKFFFRILKDYKSILSRFFFNQNKNKKTPLFFRKGGRVGHEEKKIVYKKDLTLEADCYKANTLGKLSPGWKKNIIFKQLLLGFFSSVHFSKSKAKKRERTFIFSETGFIKNFNRDPSKEYSLKGRQKLSVKYIPSNFKKSFRLKKKQAPKNKNDVSEIRKKIRVSNGLLNFPVILKILNNLIFYHGLKGFTPKTLEMIAYSSNEFFRSLLLNLGQLSLDRTKKKKRFFNEWGMKNIKEEKNRIRYLLGKKKIFENEIKNFFFSFRRKKKAKNPKPKIKTCFKKLNTKKDPGVKKKNKNSLLEENISKTNKTLMALLDGILKKRSRILKEATRCICQYKPPPSKTFVRKKPKKEANPEIFMKTQGSPQIICEWDIGNYLTGNDCLNLMRNQPIFYQKELFLKLFFSLGSDYNFRNWEKIKGNNLEKKTGN